MLKKRYHYTVTDKNRLFPEAPFDEAKRLEILSSYSILDTLPEQAYDDITSLAAHICEAPVSMVTLIDRSRQWVKSVYGENVEEMPREYAFCSYAINQPDEIMEVKDARKDKRFKDNPMVMNDPKIAFYAGAPLVTHQGYALGTLCVIDHKPKKLTPEQKDLLSKLSRLVVDQFELHRLRLTLKS